jgi:heat shock protein HtpX
LPLWTILSHQEKVALLAREIAHLSHPDASRRFLVQNAFAALARWCWLLVPPARRIAILHGGRRPGQITFGAEVATNLLMQVVSLIPQLLYHAMAYLLWPEQQQAEYRADRAAAAIAGTAAMRSLLEKCQLEGVFKMAVQKKALYHPQLDLFVEIRQRTAELTNQEWTRIKQTNEQGHTRQESSYPPTVYRLNVLATDPQLGKPELLSPSEFEQIERETAALQPAIQQQIIKAYHTGNNLPNHPMV